MLSSPNLPELLVYKIPQVTTYIETTDYSTGLGTWKALKMMIDLKIPNPMKGPRMPMTNRGLANQRPRCEVVVSRELRK